jgi:hypothetical protein
MIRKFRLIVALSFILTSACLAQFTIVNFDIRDGHPFRTPADRKVYADVVGGTLLTGTNWVAQLYCGSNAWELRAITNRPARFRPPTTTLPGVWSGGHRTIHGFAMSEPVTLQVRVWDGTQHSSFEEALAAGGIFGASAPFLFTNGNSYPAMIADALMHELRAFALDSRLQNQRPTFSGGSSLTVSGDSGPQSHPGWATSISAGPPSETSQTVSFIVTNNGPHLFSSQPAVTPTGTLAFTPAAGAFGQATVTVWLRDNGGVADGGRDISDPYTFFIEVLPANRPPLAHAQNVSTAEDQSLRIALTATDPDGDDIVFSVSSTRTLHGRIVQTDADLYYTPDADFSGDDQIAFSASDGEDSSSATINISVRPVNDLPVARITVSPLLSLTEQWTNLLILAVNGSNARVVLDGSESSDVETPTLQYAWFRENSEEVSIGPSTTSGFDVGSHIISLVVDDGETSVTATVSFDVITAADAVHMLVVMLDDSPLDRRGKRPLLATLKAAAASFESENTTSAINELEAFLRKVEVKADPALAGVRAATVVLLDALGQHDVELIEH